MGYNSVNSQDAKRFLLNSLEFCWQLSFTDQTSWPHRKQTPHTNSIKRLLYLAKKSRSHYNCRYLNISKSEPVWNNTDRRAAIMSNTYWFYRSKRWTWLKNIYTNLCQSWRDIYLLMSNLVHKTVLTERKEKKREIHLSKKNWISVG